MNKKKSSVPASCIPIKIDKEKCVRRTTPFRVARPSIRPNISMIIISNEIVNEQSSLCAHVGPNSS